MYLKITFYENSNYSFKKKVYYKEIKSHKRSYCYTN